MVTERAIPLGKRRKSHPKTREGVERAIGPVQRKKGDLY